MSIKQPKNGSGFVWNTKFASIRNAQILRKQRYVDEETLRRSEAYTPKITGNLIDSGNRGTTIGSGELHYTATYAHKQYHETEESRQYDPNRGAHWVERMKTAQGREILKGAEKA